MIISLTIDTEKTNCEEIDRAVLALETLVGTTYTQPCSVIDDSMTQAQYAAQPSTLPPDAIESAQAATEELKEVKADLVKETKKVFGHGTIATTETIKLKKDPTPDDIVAMEIDAILLYIRTKTTPITKLECQCMLKQFLAAHQDKEAGKVAVTAGVLRGKKFASIDASQYADIFAKVDMAYKALQQGDLNV